MSKYPSPLLALPQTNEFYTAVAQIDECGLDVSYGDCAADKPSNP